MATVPSSIFDRCYEKALEHNQGADATPSVREALPEGGGLVGLKVLETATVLAGPAVGMFLAECGARVLKLEPPGGDVTRQWVLPNERASMERSAYFCSVNWGKVSLVADLRNNEHQMRFHELIKESDILITNNLPNQEQDLGLSWSVLHAINPRLIVGRINGYGTGSHRPGYDSIVQAESGFVSMNGPVGGPGHKMPVALMDIIAAHQLKEGLLLALIERINDGLGKEVTVSLMDAGLASLTNQATNWWMGGHIPQPVGSEHPNIIPYGSIFTCADGQQITLAVGNDAQFDRLCGVLGWVIIPDWATLNGRHQHKEALITALASAFVKQDCATWLTALEVARVPAGTVQRVDEALQTPQALRLHLHSKGLHGLRTAVFMSESGNAILPPPPFNPDLTLTLSSLH
ncbi:MAG: CoA transferase [Sphingomonadales bacterium]|nr:CoA transferase [Sphingomonadales bacterium]